MSLGCFRWRLIRRRRRACCCSTALSAPDWGWRGRRPLTCRCRRRKEAWRSWCWGGSPTLRRRSSCRTETSPTGSRAWRRGGRQPSSKACWSARRQELNSCRRFTAAAHGRCIHKCRYCVTCWCGKNQWWNGRSVYIMSSQSHGRYFLGFLLNLTINIRNSFGFLLRVWLIFQFKQICK